MEISSYDDKKALPIGIVMEVSDGGHWHGNRWIKTGDSTWARVHGAIMVSGDELQQMVEARQNNVTPCPPESLIFPEAYAGWNINILAGGTLLAARQLRVSEDRKRVLEQRNEKARLALAGYVEEA